MPVLRSSEIKRRRSRKTKLRALRAKYETAKDNGTKEKVLAKVTRVSPSVTKEVFLSPIKKK